MPLDPVNFHRSQTVSYLPRPGWVTGFTFDPATGTFDFSGLAGFDLSRVLAIYFKHNTLLYGRPAPRPFDLAEVDGVPVPGAPASGSVIRVKPSTVGMTTDDILVVYDLD